MHPDAVAEDHHRREAAIRYLPPVRQRAETRVKYSRNGTPYIEPPRSVEELAKIYREALKYSQLRVAK